MAIPSQITVVGAGVIGLTTALALQERGFGVRVVAAASGGAITSAAAGAIWFPFRASPPELVNRWARVTRSWQAGLAETTREAGVDVVWQEVYAESDERPWWADAVDDLEPPRGDRSAARYIWRFRAPRVEPAMFCSWLMSKLARPVEYRHLASLAEVSGDLVVNCTGLGAKLLTDDNQLRGVWGQTTIVSAEGLDLGISISDERDTEDFFYSIPRRGEMVLGGCAIAQEGLVAAVPTAEWRAKILDRAARHGLNVSGVLRDSSGLRPYRDSVRLEVDRRSPRIIHNYGHGGAGYTLCQGCALDVVGLVEGLVEGLVGRREM